ncbi:unnamed protein product, partial [Brenthis ino]
MYVGNRDPKVLKWRTEAALSWQVAVGAGCMHRLALARARGRLHRPCAARATPDTPARPLRRPTRIRSSDGTSHFCVRRTT